MVPIPAQARGGRAHRLRRGEGKGEDRSVGLDRPPENKPASKGKPCGVRGRRMEGARDRRPD